MENEFNAPSAGADSILANKLQDDINSLYGKYSAQSNALYTTSLELFQTNPDKIEKFDDKIKNRIVKELYWYDSFEDAKAILWEKFYSEKEEEKENKQTDDLVSRLEKLEREKREYEYKLTQSSKSQSIDKYKKEYSSILDWVEDLDNKIEEELKLISNSVDVDTRVKYAMSIVKDKYWNKNINFASRTSGWAKPMGWWDDKPQRNPELAKIFWNKL